MRDLLEYIIKSLVLKPDEVKVSEDREGNIISFSLKVANEDMGVVIGKSGQTIRAVRRLLVTRALAENRDLTVRVNIQEEA